jgi:hypothetical protein
MPVGIPFTATFPVLFPLSLTTTVTLFGGGTACLSLVVVVNWCLGRCIDKLLRTHTNREPATGEIDCAPGDGGLAG